MANKIQNRCLICGRLFEADPQAETAYNVATFIDAPPKTQSFCHVCAAKIFKEAQDTQKRPKPL